MLVAISPPYQVIEFGVNYKEHILSSTPWIGDLDNDGYLDIIHCHGTNTRHTYAFHLP